MINRILLLCTVLAVASSNILLPSKSMVPTNPDSLILLTKKGEHVRIPYCALPVLKSCDSLLLQKYENSDIRVMPYRHQLKRVNIHIAK